MNVWYPARAGAADEPMAHGGYLELPGGDVPLARLAAALADYERGVLATELLGKSQDELTADDEALLEECLRAPTGCVRAAEPAGGPFPLVVYHAGAGSSFEDDAELCAELLQHVVEQIGALARPDMIRFTDALPKTRSGKIMRRLLRDIAAGTDTRQDMTTLEDFSVVARLRENEE